MKASNKNKYLAANVIVGVLALVGLVVSFVISFTSYEGKILPQWVSLLMGFSALVMIVVIIIFIRYRFIWFKMKLPPNNRG